MQKPFKSKNILCFLVLSFYANTIQAKGVFRDTTIEGKFIGIHVNELVRQLLPSSSSNVNNNFNYLLTYIQYKPGQIRGVRMSGNFIFNSISDNVSNTLRTTNNNIIQYKAGLERMFRFDNRFSFAYGWDVLLSINNSVTRANSNIGSIATSIKTNSNIISAGVGPGLRILYNISPNIQLGTDASLYTSTIFTGSKTIEVSNGQPFERTTSENKINYSIGINPPISLYFILKIK